MKRFSQSEMAVAAAIIVAGAIVGAALYFRSEAPAAMRGSLPSVTQGPAPSLPSAGQARPVDQNDHIRGDQNAAVAVVEFSDTECPFCKRFHPTLQQIVAEYDGRVKWVYRHFPLDALHKKARKEAEATECANELGGNEKFWAYLDRLFEVTPANDGLSPAQLPQIASDVGLNREQFASCLSSGRHAQRVADDLADAQNAGGNGTPYTVVIAPNGKTFPISGAQPYASVKAVIELALKEQ